MPIITIDSDQRLASSASTSDFSVPLSDVQSLYNVKRMVPVSIAFPNAFYNIRTGYDDVLWFQQGGESIGNITITEGFWPLVNLMAEIKALIDTQLTGGAVLTVTQDARTKKITFAISTGTIQIVYENSTMADTLGLTQTKAASSSVTTDNLPDADGLESVFIVSRALAHRNMITCNDGGTTRSILSLVPIDVKWGAQNHWRSYDDEIDGITYDTPQSFSVVDIRLENLAGDTVDLQGLRFKMVIKVEI